RPTSDRARETLFNWLQPVLADARVLDLFAGSGALGLEAVSRGAREALLVERDVAAVEALQATIARLDARDAATVVRADALALLRVPLHGRFDVVFVDPPFADGLWADVLHALPAWVNDDAWLYVESPAASTVAPGPDWRPHREAATREARHALYRRSTGRAATLAQPSPDQSTRRL
ncbi:MAG: 16S rRNA (guanine(966)-N(2))-methyltransferase RsmD, partial [Luteimonas sp.]